MDKRQDKPSILIIDDEEPIRGLLTETLSDRFFCTAVDSAEKALAVLANVEFSLVVSDINMSGISGLELVPHIAQMAPDTVVVMISGQQAIESAIEAMRVGAYDYITKPLDIRHVRAAVERAMTHHELLTQKRRYENHLEELVEKRTAEVQHLAYYDSLTDLPNRALFGDRLQQTLATAAHNNQLAALVLVSLDRFEKINDTLGHATGDLLLQQVAVRLAQRTKKGDTIARFREDEFAFLLTSIERTDEGAEFARELLEALLLSFTLGAQELYLNASIGISVFPEDGADAETIMKNAGAALFRAKRKGGSGYEFYSTDMNAEAVKRLALETDLRRAIANQEFVTYYQPVIDFSSGEVISLEALARWQHPELGILAPAEFIDIAEDTGMILALGDQVFASAAAQTRCWQDAGLPDLRIAINVSARQFREKNFPDRIAQILGQAHLDPQSVELEITETSIMEHGESALTVLREIRDMGIRIAIDDFGTGYSSLSYLKRLPIDCVKLDRSFVSGATTDPKDAALVMAIITLAHNLDLKVVAEGVETEEQRDFLKLLRCDAGQGYLFGKPMPAAVFEATISGNPRRKRNALISSGPNKSKVSHRIEIAR
ncbi:MAG TPA: EAL domain-containing protein [Pyrinomonadaceae bacterium]